MEKSALDILVEYAEKNNYKPYSHQNEYKVKTAPVANSIRDKFVLFEIKENYWFLAIDERYSHDNYSTKTGVYKLSEGNSDFDCKIEKKFFFDRLKFKTNAIGNREIDRQLNFKSNKKLPLKLITKNQTIKFLEIDKDLKPIRLIFKPNYLQKMKVFKEKYLVGLESNNWLYEASDLNLMIKNSVELLESFDDFS